MLSDNMEIVRDPTTRHLQKDTLIAVASLHVQGELWMLFLAAWSSVQP